MTTFKLNEIARELEQVKCAADNGPAFSAEDDRLAYVRLRLPPFRRACAPAAGTESLLDVMSSLPLAEGVCFEPPRLNDQVARAAEFE